MTLSFADYATLASIVALPFGLVILYLRMLRLEAVSFRTVLVKRLDRLESRVEAVEKGKADKYEWARETMLARGKIETLIGKLERLEGKLDQNFGIAGVLNRLVDELAGQRKVMHGQ